MLDAFTYILPEIFLVSMMLIALLQGLFSKNAISGYKKSLYTCVLSLVLVMALYVFAVSKFEIQKAFMLPDYTFLFINYNLVIYMKILVIFFAIVSLFILRQETFRLKDFKFEYNIVILLSVLGALVVLSSLNLIVIFIGLELLSFGVYIMLGSVGSHARKFRISGRYLVMSGLATSSILYGISVLFLQCHSVDLGNIGKYYTQYGASLEFSLGIFLIITGLLIKLGVLPMQYYLPSIAKKASRATFAMILSIVKVVVLTTLFHMVVITELFTNYEFLGLLIALFAIIFGALLSYKEDNWNRFIALSSIHNTGFILVSVVLINYKIFIFYQTLYICLVLAFLAYIESFSINGKTVRTIKDFAYVIAPSLFHKSVSFAFLVLLSGLPPLGVFLGKLSVIKHLIDTGNYAFAIVVGLGGMLMIGGFLRIAKLLSMYLDEHKHVEIESNILLKILSYSIVILSLVFGISFMMV